MITVKVKRLDPGAELPQLGSKHAACFDVYSIEDCLIKSGIVRKVRTGLAFELPPGYEMEIRPRSGLGSKGVSIANTPGTLDQDYRGELCILIYGLTDTLDPRKVYKIVKGDKIAQIKINPVLPTKFVEVAELSDTDRGTGGFGSTGR